MVDFVAAPAILPLLKNHQVRDIDVIRQGIVKNLDSSSPQESCQGVYSDLYTNEKELTKQQQRSMRKKGGPKWPNVDKLD